MELPSTLSRMYAYSDESNLKVLAAVVALTDEQLDRPIDIGPTPGSLRRILIHTYNGERVWLSRQSGQPETKWPSETVKPSIAQLTIDFSAVAAERNTWLARLNPRQLDKFQPYRESRGSLFHATLLDMILQGLTHSTHHRAQSANAIRRLGGTAPELDYMYMHRQVAE